MDFSNFSVVYTYPLVGWSPFTMFRRFFYFFILDVNPLVSTRLRNAVHCWVAFLISVLVIVRKQKFLKKCLLLQNNNSDVNNDK